MLIFRRASELPDDVRKTFETTLFEQNVVVDRIFAKLMIVQWLFAIWCAFFVSPLSWNGATSSTHIHVWSAIVLGGLIVGLPLFMVHKFKGTLSTRLCISAAQAMFSALLIHLMGGRIEAHFHIFVSLALLAAYRDRTVFAPIVLITLIDHMIRGVYWPQSVFGVLAVQSWRPFEHAAWLAFETIPLCFLTRQNLNQVYTLTMAQHSLKVERDNLENAVEHRTRELNESRDMQKHIFDSIDAEICVLDECANIVFANQRWLDFSGTNAGQQLALQPNSEPLSHCVRKDRNAFSISKELDTQIQCLCSGQQETAEVDYPGQSGDETKWYHVTANRISMRGRQLVAMVQVDITASKKADAYAESMSNLVLNSPDEVYVMSMRTLLFVEVNRGACKNLGYDRDTLLTMSPSDINPDYDRDQIRTMLEPLFNGEQQTLNFETTHQRMDGSAYLCALNLHVSELENEPVMVDFVTDISDQKRLELQLSEARKLESVGQLAAGVAHEINTPMQCVFGNVEFLQSSFKQLLSLSDHVVTMLEKSNLDWSLERRTLCELREEFRYDFLREQTPAAIEEATEASNRVISIIRAMKIMSHPGSADKAATDLHDMILNAGTITRSRWKTVAELEFDFDDSLCEIEVKAAEIGQVLINLIVNATDAITEKTDACPDKNQLGKIKIRTRTDADWVCIDVSDTGNGIPDSIRHRVFDPFFTTKEVGKGTGQGLSICHDVIVNRHSGSLSFDSRHGHGTKFTIKLPRFAKPIDSENMASEKNSPVQMMPSLQATTETTQTQGSTMVT